MAIARKIRKVIAAASVLVLLNAGAPLVPKAVAAVSFTDIEDSYAADAIRKLAEEGILGGKGGETFDPTGEIERQDFAIILAKALGLDVTSSPASPTFSDVPANHYSYDAVEAAVKAGLINGMGDGVFGTDQNLTREQMAVLFIRSLDVEAQASGDLPFEDADDISDWAKDAVAAAYELKLIQGNEEGAFNPSGNATREQVAQVADSFLTYREQLANKPPAASAIPSQLLKVQGSSSSVNLSGYFTDPEGGELKYEAAVKNGIIASASMTGSVLTLSPLTSGTTEVTVTAADAFGLTASAVVSVTVEPAYVPPAPSPTPTAPPVNRAPVVSYTAYPASLIQGSSSSSNNVAFTDPDGDTISYTATSSDDQVVEADIVGGKLSLKTRSLGEAAITITAADVHGLTGTYTFNVKVEQLVVELPASRAVHYIDLYAQYPFTKNVSADKLITSVSGPSGVEADNNGKLTIGTSLIPGEYKVKLDLNLVVNSSPEHYPVIHIIIRIT
ncbi:S-layer homology domain-containing protein [Paenibacillus sp. GCM10023252]|uniref:S-layer homology domain-containing protein n=1 Tax=Paenibacillus sp. GCM10023252 TaxID=3252649 RepID=UPI003608607E